MKLFKLNILTILILTSRRPYRFDDYNNFYEFKNVKFKDTATGEILKNDYTARFEKQQWAIGKSKKPSSKEKVHVTSYFNANRRGH